MGTTTGNLMKNLLEGLALILGLFSLVVAVEGLNDIGSGFQSSIATGNGMLLFSITLGVLGVNLALLSRR